MHPLYSCGFHEFFEKQLAQNAFDEPLAPARITATHKERYLIRTAREDKGAVLKSSLFYNGAPQENYPTTGDFVLVKENPGGDDVIYKILQRKSKLSRINSFNSFEQVVAVNFDTVFIVTSLNHEFNLSRVERYITSAWQSGGNPVILLTKSDLCPDAAQYLNALSQVAIGIPVIQTSVVTGEGIDEMEAYLTPGSTVVFIGSSGVGKSSLLNAVAHASGAGRSLSEQMIMKVNTIREDDAKGRHTTTHRQLVLLPSGAMVIDTPGMREFGMWSNEEAVTESFADIEEIVRACRFADCTHEKEPGCAVKKALRSGSITQKRLQNYYQLKREAAFAARKEKRRLTVGAKAEKSKRAEKELQRNRALEQKINSSTPLRD